MLLALRERFDALLNLPIRPWARGVLLLAPALLVLAFPSPLWTMRLTAPQYPEGLELDVYAYKVEGGREGRDLQEINTLNHYIGMREINRGELSDLDWIPFALGFLVVFGLRVAVVGEVRSLIDLTVLTGYFASFSIARFVYRLYVFGHTLDPAAAFKVEPFTPAILGSRQIANFTTHASVGLGSVWIIVFALVVVLVTLVHLFGGRRPSPASAASY